MAKRKYRASWDEVASLDCDHIAGWGALDGYVGTVDFDDMTPAKIHIEHDRKQDAISACYFSDNGKDAEPVRSTVHLERRPCRFGGTRAFFVCPTCKRRTLRLAVLPQGLRCGTCGRITWASRRETETRRLIRKANKIALRMGMNYFADQPKRPPHMRPETYARLLSELQPIKAEIERRVARRMATAKGPLGGLALIVRWGL
jgi:hypothetical protein